MSSEMDLPPTVGTLAEYSESPFERRTEWAQEGDVVRITGPDADHHMVTHPDLIQEILFTNNDAFVKFAGYTSVFGEGILTVYGDQWQAQRRTLQPAFQLDRVMSYAERMSDITGEFVARLDDGERFDARELFTDYSMQVMLQTLFGATGDQADTIGKAADRITEWFLETATAGDVPPEVQSDYEHGMDELTELIEEMIKTRQTDTGGDGVLSMLVEAGPDSEAGYTEERIRDEMITLLFGAHETSALTLTYTLYLLADAPDVGRRLRAELDDVLDGSLPSADDLSELVYTEQVIDEALRLYSPAHSLFRETVTDVTVGDHTIPEGDVVLLPQWVVHRDERWWDEPTEFRPERFGEAETDRPGFAFFPFGAGPRRCIGESFARAELKLLLAGLVDNFQFECLTQEFEMQASLTAIPDRPIEMVAHTRR